MRARILITVLALLGTFMPGKASSFNIDSIAAWGKVPAFGVKVYHIFTDIFNTYDTAYVYSPETDFKVSTSANSWITYYNFRFTNDTQLGCYSLPSTSAGIHFSWLALSVGIEKNVSTLFGGKRSGRHQWTLGFATSRFVADFLAIKSNGGLRINRVGITQRSSINPHQHFEDGEMEEWKLDAMFIFNHLHYSHSAAFSYGKIQRKSAGSWLIGLSGSGEAFHFDFSRIPGEIRDHLPIENDNYIYHTNTHLWALTGGYAANICLGRGWNFCVMETPVFGVRVGYESENRTKRVRLALSNSIKASFIYNHHNWYAGAVGINNLNIIRNHTITLSNLYVALNITAGFRFNLY